ncbi:restriction endonuclease subunit S [Microbacterium sp.]|uniref:restriction endonuclease subunit S n=1 Tax=Microbacterium sp. TaxID=51671 RepID=UPI00373544E7
MAHHVNDVTPSTENYTTPGDATLAKVLYSMGGGVRQSMSYSDLRHLRVPIPPIDEQEKVAATLNGATVAVNRALASARLAVEIAKERRAALISAAVMGKIDVGVAA